MDINKFKLLNYYYNLSVNRKNILLDKRTEHALNNQQIEEKLVADGFLSDKKPTNKGIKALEKYKVDNAVILAAGSATRFIPLSLEYPKGLFEVKGERLIERLIKQLQEAGITNITVVLGYKKEMFYYLKEKYNIKLVVNDEYQSKNNIRSIECVRESLKNTYICCCDDYFLSNPFNQFEYDSFYAGYETTENIAEMYADTDNDEKIISMQKGHNNGGEVLLGHTYWTADFSKRFIECVKNDKEGKYAQKFWEWLVKDNLSNLPNFYFKEYSINKIFEFDYFEQLRAFDHEYIGHAHSEILRNIKLVFRCDEEDIVNFRPIKEGMTNTSFIFQIDGTDYIYRHSGDGTEEIINRRNEKNSLITAKKIGIDPTYIYMDVNEGWKISKFIPSFREPDYQNFEDSKKIIKILQKLHSADLTADYGMKPWEDAVAMEQLIKGKDPHCFDKYESLKQKVEKLYAKTINDGIQKCFCHGDTYKHNWMIESNGRVYLIDWEYSGYSDPGIDVGYYIVDAMYDFDTAEKFIKTYLGDNYNSVTDFHFTAYVAIIAYYWFVWAMYRESCGAEMGESLKNWRCMAEKYADYLLEKESR